MLVFSTLLDKPCGHACNMRKTAADGVVQAGYGTSTGKKKPKL